MNFLIYAIAQLLHTVITLYILVIIVSAILSFVKPDPHNVVVQTIYKLTEPVFSFIRQKMPFVMVSNIDLSPLVVLLALQFIDTLIVRGILG